MRDFWILFLVKLHRWTGRRLREECLRDFKRGLDTAKNIHLN